jgi:hypothetical protein
MNNWNRYWWVETSSASRWWLMKSLLALLAFDVWLELPSHGGRYGVGGFNVAHFGWLDAIQPAPTPSIYVGTLLGVGLCAASLLWIRPPRWVLALLTFGYTWSWSMSMLDSYQHHYLISLILFSLTFVPSPTMAKAETDSPRSAPAYVMIATTCAIVYAFTAIAKLSPDWRSGSALRRLSGNHEGLSELRDAIGVTSETFWPGLAAATIALQFLCALAFLLVTQRGRFQNRGIRFVITGLAIAPLSFHLGAEWLGLQIGWFSYYMIAITGAYFIPEAWLRRPLIPIARLARAANGLKSELTPMHLAVLTVTALGTIWFCALRVDLPGASIAALVATFIGLILAAQAIRLRESHAGALAVSALLVASLMMWVSIASSNVRFDYYRFVGGDMRRRGQLEDSLAAYIKANQYAPRDCAALHDTSRPERNRRCDRRREEGLVRQQLRQGTGQR